MKKKRIFFRVISFFIVLFLLYKLCLTIVIPKSFTGDGFSTTSTYSDFYELEEDTVDVIFLGSSNAVCGFIPPELYHKYGISSYNLACEQQNLFTSYYWLREALRFQKPRTVVLDTAMLYLYDNEDLANSIEGLTRRAFDFMRWSPVKLEAVINMPKTWESLSVKSFIFPMIAYHERWESINLHDFKLDQFSQHSLWKGYLPLTKYAGVDGFVPITEEQALESEVDAGNLFMLSYLDLIVALCRENSIDLILTMAPSTFDDAGKYRFLSEYAYEQGITYIDFNEKGVYEDSGLEFFVDCHDDAHCNLGGALKVTDYVGKIISERIGKSTGNVSEWEFFDAEYEKYIEEVVVEAY